MKMGTNPRVQSIHAELPAVPLTLEGASVLHQMMRFRWAEWRKLPPGDKSAVLQEASALLGRMEASGETAVFSLLGHKGDLLFLHFRESLDSLNAAQLQINNLRLSELVAPASSYVSVVE